IRGFGGIDLPEWQGYSLSDSELKYAFGNGPGELGLTVLRVFVNPDKNQWNKTLKTAQYATKAGATLFATPWEPPSNLAENGSGGARGGKKHLPKSNYGAYAQHLNDFAAYMEKNGAPLYSVSVQNEPDYASEWTAWSTDETTDFIANYGDKITNTKLMSPESFQYGAWNDGKDYYSKILKNSKAMANCDVFGTHFYGTPRERMDFPDLENCGKEIWMTEVYVPGSDYQNANIWVGKDLQNKNDASAIKVAENIHNGLVVGNMSVYTWWYIKRYYSLIGEERSGIMSSSEAGKPTKRGYAMAQYSKWVRPGYRRTAATEQPNSGVLVSAYKGDNNKVVIVAINQGSDVTQEFSVSGQTLKNVDRYRTTSSENLAETKGMETNGGNFFAQLPSNSVSTFVCTIAGDHGVDGSGADVAPGTTPIEPDSNGYYFHDTFENGVDDWEARGGSVEIKQSGRQPYAGTEALVVTNRESSWQGVQKSLPSNTFKSGESYSFSVISTFLDSDIDSQKLSLSLQYKDASGETAYAHIADVTAYKGEYVQLANPSYKLPDGSDFILYVETAEGTDNFYIDEAIVAKDGTKIDGPTPVEFTLGDIDSNGVINAVDVAMARKIVLGGAADAAAKKAADVNKDGEVNIADAVLLQKFVLADISDFKASANTTPDNNTGNTGNTENTGSSAVMRSMSEYTPIVQAAVVESEPSEANQTKNGVEYGTLEKKSYFSDFCGREKKYNVLLPAGYTTSKKYPVLYVLHGYWEDQDRMILTGNGASSMTVKQVLGNAMAEGAAKDMIVVFPNVYSSQTQDACSGMDDANNIAYDNFETVLIKELMPLIEKNYSAATGRENTAITGFSMGGRESLNIGTKHPDLFGYVGAICPAPGATPVTKFTSEENAPSLIFITAGGNDQTVYNIPEGYHNSLTSAGTPHIWHYYNAGYHGDNSIRAHLYNFVRAVFKA
ncbi:MAG: carbohydrate binding domain-containing protein, partial [Ruminococcus sp.]|nr:carbohydrate binding domain-containing protein [Ruminococcus sp.]